MKTDKRRIIYRILSLVILFIIMLFVFLLSHQTADDSSQTSGQLTSFLSLIFGENIPDGLIRTIAHFIEFGALGFFMNNAFFAFKEKGYIFLPVLFSFLYCVTDEIHQLFIPGRAFQFTDLLVDFIGVFAGVIVFYFFTTMHKKKHSQLKISLP